MDLPILKTSSAASPETLVRYFHQTETKWTEHVAEGSLLDCGVAFGNPQLANVRRANRILDAALPAGMSADEAYDRVDAHFRHIGATCWQWILNPSAPKDQTDGIRQLLLQKGYRAVATDILHLPRVGVLVPFRDAQIKVIPARASFRHAEQINREAAALWKEPQLADAAMLHLDDPHYDAQVAIRDGRAVAYAGVLAVGEIGRIDEVFVSEADRRKGLGSAIVSRVLEACARSLFKHVLLGVGSDHFPAIEMFTKLGFRKVGEMIEYQKPAP